ncbi:carboxymuconolactone decarboxylase family protein [Paraburkholderia sp. B3]|uniref:carboxymuconolactone decarboxylase family protein n=1 Tax=Paraburkholderia sp. B3 TaxID=3134791 RepID=UPI003982AFF3
MSRLAVPDRDDVPEGSRKILDAVHDWLGVVPNAFRLMGSNPAVLRGYSVMNQVLMDTLDTKTLARIALAVAQLYSCDYLVSEQRYLALNVARMPPEEIELSRIGQASSARTKAVLAFALKVAGERGQISADDVEAIRNAGLSHAEILAVVGAVSLNVMTSLLCQVSKVEIDFPVLRCSEWI